VPSNSWLKSNGSIDRNVEVYCRCGHQSSLDVLALSDEVNVPKREASPSMQQNEVSGPIKAARIVVSKNTDPGTKELRADTGLPLC
jgi:hypothetical protein